MAKRKRGKNASSSTSAKSRTLAANAATSPPRRSSRRITHPKEQCRLLQLPLELRTMILELALVKEGSKPALSDKGHDNGPDAEPHLLRTCRLARKEGLPIFYGQNEWVAKARPIDETLSYECVATSKWLDELPGKKIHMIKTVIIVERDGLYKATADNAYGYEILRGPIAAWKIRYISGHRRKAEYDINFINIRNIPGFESYGKIRREAVESRMEYQVDFRRVKTWTRSDVWDMHRMFD